MTRTSIFAYDSHSFKDQRAASLNQDIHSPDINNVYTFHPPSVTPTNKKMSIEKLGIEEVFRTSKSIKQYPQTSEEIGDSHHFFSSVLESSIESESYDRILNENKQSKEENKNNKNNRNKENKENKENKHHNQDEVESLRVTMSPSDSISLPVSPSPSLPSIYSISKIAQLPSLYISFVPSTILSSFPSQEPSRVSTPSPSSYPIQNLTRLPTRMISSSDMAVFSTPTTSNISIVSPTSMNSQQSPVLRTPSYMPSSMSSGIATSIGIPTTPPTCSPNSTVPSYYPTTTPSLPPSLSLPTPNIQHFQVTSYPILSPSYSPTSSQVSFSSPTTKWSKRDMKKLLSNIMLIIVLIAAFYQAFICCRKAWKKKTQIR